jgi:murein L,D-transpeptidase YafK
VNTSRAVLRRLAAALALASTLAACYTFDYDLAQPERSVQPIPAKLVATMNSRQMSPQDPILVRVYKQESELEVWKKDRTGRYALLKTYPICRWSGKLGPKVRAGDRQAPEGFYRVAAAQMNPDSRYYLSFNLGYPNPLEAALGHSGEALMIHGACSSSGCYAITDQAAAEIYALAREAFRGGQEAFQVQALPFRMTAANLAEHSGDPNMAFWSTLKDGSDHFEVTRQEPRVGYCGGRYVFNAANIDGLSPTEPCPVLETDPTLAGAVVAKQQSDLGKAEVLAGTVAAQPPIAYVDGGMHPSFRSILERSGPERLAKLTSERAPVSRPEAALADPYRPRSLLVR